ncbi:hypothetical protein LguiB_034410 [Lonicera macranthoides]
MSTTDNSPPPVPEPYTSPSVTIIVAIILLVFFFIGFFSIYFCRCFMQSLEDSLNNRPSPSNGTLVAPPGVGGLPGGLDPLIIQSFPTFTYESVKDYRREKYGLECAICLCEFEDESILKFLTNCCHVFHQECIDTWLESHNSCPVCRRRLDDIGKSPDKSPMTLLNTGTMHDIDENEPLEDHSFCISIKDENNNERGASSSAAAMAGAQAADKQVKGRDEVERFPRSNSTGHSIVSSNRSAEEDKKYTLILPEHIKAKLIRGHCVIKSCTTFGEYKSKTSSGNGGFGEVSGLSSGDVNKV